MVSPNAMMPFDGGGRSAGTSDFSARNFIESDRYKELDRREQYFTCTQHDWKRYDFEGRMIPSGGNATQPLLASEQAGWYVPLKLRRPSSPYRIGRVIVQSFTSMLFGEQRWPSVICRGDEDTQDFAEALMQAASIPVKFLEARNLGGSVGTVGMSWCYNDGTPRVDVHNGKHLFVHEWKNREELIPAWVTEIYRFYRDEWDPTKQQWVRNWYWYRRDWTEESDVTFEEVLFEENRDPEWTVDEQVDHGDGFCHFVWIQNLPNADPDGIPDYEGLYDNFDTIDILNSVLARGTILNLDPTLVLKMDRDLVQRMGVKKGSDNALVVGVDGDADYLELAGSAVEAGNNLFEAKRRQVLEVAQCVVPDPNEIAAGGTSSVALKVIYAPMISKTEVLREQYGKALRRLIEQMVAVAQDKYSSEPSVTDEESGEEVDAQYVINVPQRAVSKPKMDDQGNPSGEETTELVDRHPGEGENFELQWGPYFAPTPDDQAKTATWLQMATGMQAFMDVRTATELMAQQCNRDPNEEWTRVVKTAALKHQQVMAMTGVGGGDVGGKVEDRDQLPDGAVPRQPKTSEADSSDPDEQDSADPTAQAKPAVPKPAQPPQVPDPSAAGDSDADSADAAPQAKPANVPVVPGHVPDHTAIKPAAKAAAPALPKLAIAPDDVALVVSVNEVRMMNGLGPLMKGGKPDPEGEMMMADFKAMHGQKVADNVKASKGEGPEDEPPPPPMVMGAKPGQPGAVPPGGKGAPPFGKATTPDQGAEPPKGKEPPDE